MSAGDRKSALRRQQAIYARIVAAMRYPDASGLVQELGRERTRRYSPRELSTRWAAAAENSSADAIWNLYVHVPYCKSICDFCNYKRLRVSSREALDRYVAFIVSEMRLFAPVLGGVRFGGLYVGGGTPSVLSAAQLERLFDSLFACFAFRAGAVKTFEFDPMVMTEDRYSIVQRFGFARFSFGIQSVDVEVNRLHNRGSQTRLHIDRQFESLTAIGAEETNVDFLLGLSGTTPEQMLSEIEQVLSAHVPETVSVYFMFPTPEYVAKHFGGEIARFKAFIARFEASVPPALRALADRYGYAIEVDGKHNMLLSLREPAKGSSAELPPSYCDVPSVVHRPLHVLGFGDSARSRIFGSMLYRADHEHHDADDARYVGFETTLEDEIFAYVAMVLRDGNAISRRLFQRTFGRDPRDALERPLAKLVELGAAQLEADAIVFEPQSAEERLRDLLFFLPRERRGALEALGSLSVRARFAG